MNPLGQFCLGKHTRGQSILNDFLYLRPYFGVRSQHLIGGGINFCRIDRRVIYLWNSGLRLRYTPRLRLWLQTPKLRLRQSILTD
jgi:hypothetical protein